MALQWPKTQEVGSTTMDKFPLTSDSPAPCCTTHDRPAQCPLGPMASMKQHMPLTLDNACPLFLAGLTFSKSPWPFMDYALLSELVPSLHPSCMSGTTHVPWKLDTCLKIMFVLETMGKKGLPISWDQTSIKSQRALSSGHNFRHSICLSLRMRFSGTLPSPPKKTAKGLRE